MLDTKSGSLVAIGKDWQACSCLFINLILAHREADLYEIALLLLNRI